MTGSQRWHCPPCRRGQCDDCSRLLWGPEVCHHSCLEDVPLALFSVDQVTRIPRPRQAPPDVDYEDVDW